MALTWGELKEILEDFSDEDLEYNIVFASQPSYPLQYTVNISEPIEDEETKKKYGPVILTEGRQVGYLPGELSIELGWR